MRKQNRRLGRRRGLGLIWSMVFILGLCAIASLAVDYGRVQVVKTQLRSAADASALAAGQLLLSDAAAARRAAIEVAKANKADGAEVKLNPAQDIEMVYRDEATRSHQPATATLKANAVKVTARRIAARGNAVDLPFARMLGANTCDVSATAIALAKPTRYAMVGLDFIKMGGNSTNSYRR
ncbi:MAG: TadG family pilus assembly protein, partial [Tepidisphaeraceae bacterium]